MKRLSPGAIRFHRGVYGTLKWLLGGFFRRLFAFSHTPSELPEGPGLVMANHNMDLDAVLLGMSLPHMYFVASDHIFDTPLLAGLLRWLISPISRKKGSIDAGTVLEMRRRLQAGCRVGIFPEGNRSLDGRTGPLHPTTGKLVKSCGVPLVTYKLTGGFLTSPRWSHSNRKGKMTGHVVAVYSPEELSAMSPAEITELIRRDLREDAYETQTRERVQYRGKRLAKGLESALYLCPHCRGIGTLRSDDHHIRCGCGLSARYDEYGYFVDRAHLDFATFTEWYDWQQEALVAVLTGGDGGVLKVDHDISLLRPKPTGKGYRKTSASVTLKADEIRLEPQGEGPIDIAMADISSMAFYGRCNLVFTAKGQYYVIKSKQDFNARLYLDVRQFTMKRGD